MAHMSVPANDGNTGTNGALTRHLITQQVDGFLCFASDASSSASLPSGIYHLPSTITAPRAKRPNPISTALGPSRWSTRRMHQRMYLGTTTIMDFFFIVKQSGVSRSCSSCSSLSTHSPHPSPQAARAQPKNSKDASGFLSIENYLYRPDPFLLTRLPEPLSYPVDINPA